jgi:DNA repair exonuclease SbcCD ATPase subunit
MILRSISLEGWRCFANPVRLGPFSEGLSVLYAPNGCGKSTLFEALIRALLDGHRVSGRDAEAMRPWGRSLAPTVSVEFTHAGADYRLTKRFLDHPSSELERRESGRYVRLDQGEAADETVRQILRSSPPGRGLARLENWGLAQILWVPQGRLEVAGLSGDLVLDIRAYLGAHVPGTAATRLETRIQEIYAQFFTSQGKLRSGREAPALVSLREKHVAAQDQERDALALLEAFEASARRVEDLRAQRAQARRDAEAVSQALAEARRRAGSYRELFSERAAQQERAKAAEAQYGELKSRVDEIHTSTRELNQAQEAIQRLRADLQYWGREVEDRQNQAAKTKAALEDVRKDAGQVEQAQRQADLAQRFADCRKAIDELDARLARIAQAAAALDESKQARAVLVAPEAKALRAIRKALKERDEAQVHIDAALITLEITPVADTPATLLAGEDPGQKPLRAGAPAKFRGSPEVVVDLPGLARLRASGPVESVGEYRTRREAAFRRLEQLTEGFATTDLETLETLGETAKELDQRVAKAQTQLDTLLGDESVEDVAQDRAKVGAVRAQILEAFPVWAENPPDVEALREAAQAVRRAFDDALENAELAWQKPQEALASATQQLAALAARLDETEKQVKSLTARLAVLTSDAKPDQQREVELSQAAIAWDAARRVLAEVEIQLAAFDDNPEDTVAKLAQQLQAAEETATQARDKEKTEEGRLEHLSVQGPYSGLALAQEELARLERQVAEEESRTAAIRLLHETVAQCRAEAVAAVAGPVEAAATRIFQRVAGRRLGRVQFGGDFAPLHVLPEMAGGPVPVENASGGEKEQIFLAARLALAEVLAKDERQLVVLDDVLLATDAPRLARVMSVLEEAAQRLQVVVLTCHPERYRGLGTAQFLDVEALVASAPSAPLR